MTISRDMYNELKQYMMTEVHQNHPWVDADENDRSQIQFTLAHFRH